LFGETSRNLLLKAGLVSGMRVLEIGCGTGNMTGWIADQVGKNGHVTAVDISEEQIEIAKVNNKLHNNIEFIVKSIFDLADLSQFDMIYSRFVIMHQVKPFDALKVLMPLLKKNGVLVCEEGTNTVSACCPHSDIFQKYRGLLLELFKMKNLDHDFGSNIYTNFRKLELKDITTNFIQPIYQSSAQKKMMLLFLTEMKPQYVKNNLISEVEINKLIFDMRTFIQDDNYMVSFVRTTQIYGKK
ncbi:MAG: methyltransferase domain-containing protein, partial [Gammaproteobacteria bacterium]|nr:methyltransferase domain-containing protein [Gammaproteobacteria bacterium]